MPNNPTWSTGYKPVAKDLKGLYHHRFDTARGLVIQCYLEFQPEERATYDEPGCAAQIDLIWALVEGVNISEVLSVEAVLAIEEEAIEGMATAADDERADVAADRLEDARCAA